MWGGSRMHEKELEHLKKLSEEMALRMRRIKEMVHEVYLEITRTVNEPYNLNEDKE